VGTVFHWPTEGADPFAPPLLVETEA